MRGVGVTNNYLVKTDSAGDTIWSKTYGTLGDNGACFAEPCASGFLMSGLWDTIVSNGIGGASYIAKLDTQGNILWAKLYGDTVNIDYCHELPNGDIIGVGQKNKPSGYFFYGGLLTKINTNGNTLWERTLVYQGNDVDTTYSRYGSGVFWNFNACPDGGFILTGDAVYNTSSTEQLQKMWLVKTDSNGCIANYCGLVADALVGIDELEAKIQLRIYPNPAANQVTIDCQQAVTDDVQWTVYNLLGQQIATGKMQRQPNVTIEVFAFQKGWYVVKIIAKDKKLRRQVFGGVAIITLQISIGAINNRQNTHKNQV